MTRERIFLFTAFYIIERHGERLQHLQSITVTLEMVGKVGVSATNAIIYLWSAEVYPTTVRNVGMGASASFARIGGMISKYIVDLGTAVDGETGQALPLVVFGVAAVISGFLSLALPETIKEHLPDTIKDGEQLGKNATKGKENLQGENGYFTDTTYL